MELVLHPASVLTDDVAVEAGLGRVLGRHRAGLVSLLENVVGERVPEETGLGLGLAPPAAPSAGQLYNSIKVRSKDISVPNPSLAQLEA